MSGRGRGVGVGGWSAVDFDFFIFIIVGVLVSKLEDVVDLNGRTRNSLQFTYARSFVRSFLLFVRNTARHEASIERAREK